jgi:hypothetical protein
MPAAALAPDVTLHDVNWGAEGARRYVKLQATHDGFGLARQHAGTWCWAQGAVGVTSVKHFFQVCVTAHRNDGLALGWADDKISTTKHDFLGINSTLSTGAAYLTTGCVYFGTAPLANDSFSAAPRTLNARQCAIGCLLDLAATPARMTVFIEGEPLAVQCEYDFPKDGRAWFSSVSLWSTATTLHSCAV